MLIGPEFFDMTHDNGQQVLTKRFVLLFAAAQSPILQVLLMEMCRRDILFWFNWFCWTFDPRLPQPHQPFKLYPFQIQALRDIVNAMEKGEDLLIENTSVRFIS